MYKKIYNFNSIVVKVLVLVYVIEYDDMFIGVVWLGRVRIIYENEKV